jgi:non-heme chloroperoxidase
MIWISTSLLYPVHAPNFPDALLRDAWDSTLDAMRHDSPSFLFNAFRGAFGVGTSREVSDKQIAHFERIFFQSDPIAVERCLQTFTSVDLSENIQELGHAFKHPFLLIHGSADGGVRTAASAELVKKLIPQGEYRNYEGGGHSKFVLLQDTRLPC